MNDLEFAALVGKICDACQDGLNPAAKAQRKRDLIDILREFSPQISAIRDEAIAEELSRQAAFYWESAAMHEPAQMVLSQGGEEAGAALLDVSIRIMREVSAKLKRRSAELRGVSVEELALRGLLVIPDDITFGPAATEHEKKEGGPDDGSGTSVE